METNKIKFIASNLKNFILKNNDLNYSFCYDYNNNSCEFYFYKYENIEKTIIVKDIFKFSLKEFY